MPPFYIGSTSVERIQKGYHGSVSSAKWKGIWQSELKNNPHLFFTFIIPNTYVNSKKSKLKYEIVWQKAFEVVENEHFINSVYATGKFFTTKEAIMKALETKRIKGKLKHSALTIEKLKLAAKSRPAMTRETRQKISNSNKGRKRSQETVNKIKAARARSTYTHSPETIEKIRSSKIGKPHAIESVKKAIATRMKNGYKHSTETKTKIGNSNSGKIVSESTKLLISRSRTEKRWYNNGVLEKSSSVCPGPEWMKGRLKGKNTNGTNGNSTQVLFNGTLYDSVCAAMQSTNLSRYKLLKAGAVFIRKTTQMY